MDESLRQILGEITKISTKLDNVSDKVDKVESRLDILATRFDKLEIRFDPVEANQLRMEQTTYDKFGAIFDWREQQIEQSDQIYNKLILIDSKINLIQTSLSIHESRFDKLRKI